MALPHVIVIDLDGTLVHSDGTVTAANRAALARARASGIDVLIATGRTWSECRTLLDATGLDGPVVTAGGSRLVQHPDHLTLDRIDMDPCMAQEAAQILVQHGLGVLILRDPEDDGVEYLHLGPHPLHAVSTWWHARHGHEVHALDTLDDVGKLHGVLRIAAVATPGTFQAPMAALDERLGDRARVWHWEAVIDPALGHEAVHLMEVFDPSACKWTMVQRWCASHGRDPAQVVAIGDGLNDVAIVRLAPLGVAMGNADPRVRAVADHVAPHHDDDGVAQVIDALLSGALEVVP